MEAKRLGADPLEWIKDTRKGAEGEKGKKKGGKSVRQKDSKTENQENSNLLRKATYYVRPENIKALKYLSADTERDLSDLVNEARTW